MSFVLVWSVSCAQQQQYFFGNLHFCFCYIIVLPLDPPSPTPLIYILVYVLLYHPCVLSLVCIFRLLRQFHLLLPWSTIEIPRLKIS